MFRTVMAGMVAGALTLSALGVYAQHGGKDIVETAVAAGSFKTLAKASTTLLDSQIDFREFLQGS